MRLIRKKIIDFIKKINVIKEINYNKFDFYFLFGLKNSYTRFDVNLGTKCLVLSQYPGAETKGLGGLIAQYPKNFEVLCFTNGSNMLSQLNPVKSAGIKRQEFHDVMKMARVKGYKIFDIDDKTLKNHYSTFKKIDISDADYIFIPNVYDDNTDTIALLKHFKQFLKTKEYKPELKIMMFETSYPLCTTDYYSDISSIIETKKKMLKHYYPENEYPLLIDKIIGINAFRAIRNNCNYCETFMSISVDEFLKLPLIQ